MKSGQENSQQSIAQQKSPIDSSAPLQGNINHFYVTDQTEGKELPIHNNVLKTLQSPFISLSKLANISIQSKSISKKANMPEQSDSYHRVTNSRKIKTKKAKKSLVCSEYFYFSNPNEQGNESPIAKLLNQYERFQQMITAQDFSFTEKRIIRLSHYGNKKKSQNHKTNSIERLEIIRSQRINKTESNAEQKPLSKSVVVEIPQIIQKNSPNKDESQKYEFENRVKQRKTSITKKNNLTKYTTPIRTIYLNKIQQSFGNPHQSRSAEVHQTILKTSLRNHSNLCPQNLLQKSSLNNQFVKNQERNYSLKAIKNRSLIDSKACPDLKTGLEVVSSIKKQNYFQFSCVLNKNQHISEKEHKPLLKFLKSCENMQRKVAEKNETRNNSAKLNSQSQNTKSQNKMRKGLSVTQSSSKKLQKSSNSISKTPQGRLQIVATANINLIMTRKLANYRAYNSKKPQFRIH